MIISRTKWNSIERKCNHFEIKEKVWTREKECTEWLLKYDKRNKKHCWPTIEIPTECFTYYTMPLVEVNGSPVSVGRAAIRDRLIGRHSGHLWGLSEAGLGQDAGIVDGVIIHHRRTASSTSSRHGVQPCRARVAGNVWAMGPFRNGRVDGTRQALKTTVGVTVSGAEVDRWIGWAMMGGGREVDGAVGIFANDDIVDTAHTIQRENAG